MGFFRSKYDLYSEIISNPDGFESNISQICRVTGRRDLEQDFIDAIRDIDNGFGFKDSLSTLGFLLDTFSAFCDKNMEI